MVFQGLLPQMRSSLDKIFSSDPLQGIVSHMSRFLMQSENSSKLSQNTHFLAHFWRFFVYALLRPMSHASIFFQIEGLIKIHYRNKFHSVCGYQVIIFSFSY